MVQVVQSRGTAVRLHMPLPQLLAMGSDITHGPLQREAEQGNNALQAVEDNLAGLLQASAAENQTMPGHLRTSPPHQLPMGPQPQPADDYLPTIGTAAAQYVLGAVTMRAKHGGAQVTCFTFPPH